MNQKGHYASHLHEPQTNTFTLPQDLTITITVDEVFSNDHRVYNSRAASTGKFTFSAADSGDHRICFTPSLPSYSGGWSGSFTHSGGKGIKVELDLVVGETSKIESEDKGKMSEIAQKVKDLNARLLDIKREQVFQRVRPTFSMCLIQCLSSDSMLGLFSAQCANVEALHGKRED